jgi:glucose-1-phosphate thymidylyltransferase
MVMLGDNFVYGSGMGRNLGVLEDSESAGIITIEVNNPEEFGVLVQSREGVPLELVEKPTNKVSNLAIPGIYFFPSNVFSRIELLEKSKRGEYEITDLLNIYLQKSTLNVQNISRGATWFDCGTINRFIEVSEFVRVMQGSQGMLIGSPHESSLKMEKLSKVEIISLIESKPESPYWSFLKSVIN